MSTKFEKDALNELNKFRREPKSIQHQVEVLRKAMSRLKAKDPFLGEIDSFIEDLGKIPKMKPLVYNKSLSKIARDEVKKFSRDEENYNRYRTGRELIGIVPEQYIKENASLIADDGFDDPVSMIPKLILNKMDVDRKGRKMITTQEFTQFGIATCEYKDENYAILIFANKDCSDDIEGELPNIDLTELKQAFDLYDHDGTQKIKIQEALEGMRAAKYDRTNPELYKIVKELSKFDLCTWPRFASYIYGRITDRYTDEGLRTLFELFKEDPKKDTISSDNFKRICDEVGENLTKEEAKNILGLTTGNGREITFEDFCNFMKLNE